MKKTPRAKAGPDLNRNNPAIARDGRKLEKIIAAYVPLRKILNKKRAQLARLCNRAAKGKGWPKFMDQATFEKTQRVKDKISTRIGLPKIYAQCKPYGDKIFALSQKILRMEVKTVADLGVMLRAFLLAQQAHGDSYSDMDEETRALIANIARLAGVKLPAL